MAILGSASFDVGDVDLDSLAFGPAGARPLWDPDRPLPFGGAAWVD